MASTHTEKTRAGSTRYRVKWRDETNRQRSRSFDTRGEAMKFAAEVELGEALDPRDARRTVADFIARDYLPAHRHGWSESTAELVESHVRNHIRPALGPMRLGDVRASTLGKFVGELRAKGLAAATVEAVYARAVAILRAAHRDRLIPVVPELPPAERPRSSSAAQELRLLDPADVVDLAEHMSPFYRPLVWLIAGTGLRIGEATAVTVEALDLDAGELLVDRKLGTPTYGPARLEANLKTPASRRTVPLGARAREDLSELIERQEFAEAPDPIDGVRRLVFTNRDGRPIRRSVAGDAWARARTRAGISEDVATGWHALRHYYASALIRQGLSILEVQARLGHASSEETLGTYGHLWHDAGARTVEAVDSFIPSRARRLRPA